MVLRIVIIISAILNTLSICLAQNKLALQIVATLYMITTHFVWYYINKNSL